jgi:hypothetical protein
MPKALRNSRTSAAPQPSNESSKVGVCVSPVRNLPPIRGSSQPADTRSIKMGTLMRAISTDRPSLIGTTWRKMDGLYWLRATRSLKCSRRQVVYQPSSSGSARTNTRRQLSGTSACRIAAILPEPRLWRQEWTRGGRRAGERISGRWHRRPALPSRPTAATPLPSGPRSTGSPARSASAPADRAHRRGSEPPRPSRRVGV